MNKGHTTIRSALCHRMIELALQHAQAMHDPDKLAEFHTEHDEELRATSLRLGLSTDTPENLYE